MLPAHKAPRPRPPLSQAHGPHKAWAGGRTSDRPTTHSRPQGALAGRLHTWVWRWTHRTPRDGPKKPSASQQLSVQRLDCRAAHAVASGEAGGPGRLSSRKEHVPRCPQGGRWTVSEQSPNPKLSQRRSSGQPGRPAGAARLGSTWGGLGKAPSSQGLRSPEAAPQRLRLLPEPGSEPRRGPRSCRPFLGTSSPAVGIWDAAAWGLRGLLGEHELAALGALCGGHRGGGGDPEEPGRGSQGQCRAWEGTRETVSRHHFLCSLLH